MENVKDELSSVKSFCVFSEEVGAIDSADDEYVKYLERSYEFCTDRYTELNEKVSDLSNVMIRAGLTPKQIGMIWDHFYGE